MSVRSGRAAIALGPRPTSAAEARSFVRSKLDDLAVPEPPLEDAVLLTSELVSNALLHARTDIEVRLRTDSRRVRVEVHDQNTRYPVLQRVPPDATSGRGFLLVEGLANAWGIDGTTGGKAVWFEMNLDADDTGSDKTLTGV